MDQQKDGTARPDGRQQNKRKVEQEIPGTKQESSDTELEIPNKYFYVQLVGQGRHKRPERRQR